MNQGNKYTDSDSNRDVTKANHGICNRIYIQSIYKWYNIHGVRSQVLMVANIKTSSGLLRCVVLQKLTDVSTIMEAVRTSETSVNLHQTTRRNIPEIDM